MGKTHRTLYMCLRIACSILYIERNDKVRKATRMESENWNRDYNLDVNSSKFYIICSESLHEMEWPFSFFSAFSFPLSFMSAALFALLPVVNSPCHCASFLRFYSLLIHLVFALLFCSFRFYFAVFCRFHSFIHLSFSHTYTVHTYTFCTLFCSFSFCSYLFNRQFSLCEINYGQR